MLDNCNYPMVDGGVARGVRVRKSEGIDKAQVYALV